MSSVGAPDIHRTFPTSYAELAVVLLLVPGALALLLEPPMFLLADRLPRHWFIAGGTAAMAAGFALCAVAPSAWWLAVSLALTYAANGVAVSLAQASLVDLNPERRARVMARWSLLGLLGDLGTPALLVALAWLGLGWRAAFALMAVLLGAWAILLARRPLRRPRRSPASPASPVSLVRPVSPARPARAGGRRRPGCSARCSWRCARRSSSSGCSG